jgi:hypothetical protein
MNKVYEGSLKLVQALRVEPWFLVPINDFDKIGKNFDQDKEALSTLVPRLIDNLPEIYTSEIPKIIGELRAELQAVYKRDYSALVKDINYLKHLVRPVVDQLSDGSWDGVLRKVNLERFTPKDKYETKDKFALQKFGIFAEEFNKAVDKVHAKIGASLEGDGIVEVGKFIFH